MTHLFFYILLGLNLVFFFIVLYNFFCAPRVKLNSTFNPANKLISVLIPARNEQNNIERCVKSVSYQSLTNLEILVLNDQSTDNTKNIVLNLAKNDSRICLIDGEELPKGWLGKNWACHQLSQKANGKIILFIDADVELKADAIAVSLKIFTDKKVKLLSVFPSQVINSFGAHLVTPLMNWLLLSFLPLKFVYSKKNKAFTAANGQFMMFDASAYNILGGHKAVRSKVVEDMELARLIKSSNHKMITALGDKLIYCNMYSTFKDSFNGFSKNFYTGFGENFLQFSMLLILIVLLFILPMLLVFINYYFLLIILFGLLARLMISYTSRQSVIMNLITHPLQMILLPIIGINSIVKTFSKTIEWKGRKIF